MISGFRKLGYLASHEIYGYEYSKNYRVLVIPNSDVEHGKVNALDLFITQRYDLRMYGLGKNKIYSKRYYETIYRALINPIIYQDWNRICDSKVFNNNLLRYLAIHDFHLSPETVDVNPYKHNAENLLLQLQSMSTKEIDNFFHRHSGFTVVTEEEKYNSRCQLIKDNIGTQIQKKQLEKEKDTALVPKASVRAASPSDW